MCRRRERDVVERRRIAVAQQAVRATAVRHAIATSAGATARGWRPTAPSFGVTTNPPRRPAASSTVDCTWIQKLAACSANALNV